MSARFPVRREFLRADPRVTVARATLGLTVYLANGMSWAREGALAALSRFAQHVGRERLRWHSLSKDDRWLPMRGDSLERLAALLALPEHYTRTRHMLQVRVVDDTDAPSVAFIYRELDEERSPCAGYLQCIVPADHPLEDFTQLTLSVLGLGLWWSASAGYLASWNLAERATSFATLRRWCRRYHGLDVQDPDVTVRRATQSLT